MEKDKDLISQYVELNNFRKFCKKKAIQNLLSEFRTKFIDNESKRVLDGSPEGLNKEDGRREAIKEIFDFLVQN